MGSLLSLSQFAALERRYKLALYSAMRTKYFWLIFLSELILLVYRDFCQISKNLTRVFNCSKNIHCITVHLLLATLPGQNSFTNSTILLFRDWGMLNHQEKVNQVILELGVLFTSLHQKIIQTTLSHQGLL